MLNPPEKSRSAGFLAALTIGWIVLAAAGALYARSKNIPGWVAIPLLIAILLEYPFYLVLAFPTLRDRLSAKLPLWLIAIAVVPYAVCCLGPVEFHWMALLRVAALAVVFGLWYRLLPRLLLVDLLFLALFPAVLLGGYFKTVYIPSYPVKDGLTFLGNLTLMVMFLLALMAGRRIRDAGFGFLPTGREWRVGALHFLVFLAIGLPLALALQLIRVKTPAPLWSIGGTLLGYLWVAALVPDFLLWGVLRDWLRDRGWNPLGTLVFTSVVFGLAHLWFRGFPNWRWALLATVLGLCSGNARDRAGGIRAAAVTHSLVVATWRAFFA